MHMSRSEKWSKSLLFVSDTGGSAMKKRVNSFSANDVIGTKLRVGMTTDCLQASFVHLRFDSIVDHCERNKLFLLYCIVLYW